MIDLFVGFILVILFILFVVVPLLFFATAVVGALFVVLKFVVSVVETSKKSS